MSHLKRWASAKVAVGYAPTVSPTWIWTQIAIVVFVRAVRRRFAQETSASTYWIRRGAVVGLLAIALQEIVDFSLQMPGNAFLFAVLCAIALHGTPSRRA